MTYQEFIQNILDTRGRFACGEEYHERHHIVPKCMNGTNDEENLIDLFAREHFEAHRLLALESPDNKDLVYAWKCMVILGNGLQKRYIVSPEEYEEMRILFHNTLSGENNPRAKPVINLTTMKIYPTAGIAEEETGIDDNAIQMCCTENRQTAGGCIWRYYNDDVREKIMNQYPFPTIEEVTSEKRKKLSDRCKARFQDINERIKNRDRVKRAYENPEYHQKQSIAKIGGKNPQAKPVICIETRCIYEAASVAERETGINKNLIGLCCRGVRKDAGGFQWKFIYDTARKNEEFILGAISLELITEEETLKQLNKIQND